MLFMPALYDKLGVSFQYPDNWRVDENDAVEGGKSVSVYSPGGAFWSLVVHPRKVEPEMLVEAAVDAMRQEYDELDCEAVRDTIAAHELNGYDLIFYCLDLTNTALIRGVRTARRTYLLLCQADDREFAE